MLQEGIVIQRFMLVPGDDGRWSMGMFALGGLFELFWRPHRSGAGTFRMLMVRPPGLQVGLSRGCLRVSRRLRERPYLRTLVCVQSARNARQYTRDGGLR